MPHEATVTRIGGSLGLIIPKPIADALDLHQGEHVELTIKDRQTLVLRRNTNKER